MSTDESLDELRNDAINGLRQIEQRLGILLLPIVMSDQPHLDKMKSIRALVVEAVNRGNLFDDSSLEDVREDDVELEPSFTTTQYNFDIVRNYTGSEVRDYVLRLRKKLDQLSTSSNDAAYVSTAVSGFVLTVGGKFTWHFIKELAVQATKRAALTAALSSVGLKFATTSALLLVIGILIYFAFLTERNMLGVICNDTDHNFVSPNWRGSVNNYNGGNIYMRHGSTVNFPEDNTTGDLDSQLVQLKSRSYESLASPAGSQLTTGSKDILVSQTIFFGRKNAGFFGVEGIYIFNSTENSSIGFSYMFAVPFNQDNRGNIAFWGQGAVSTKSQISDCYDQMYETASVDTVITSNGFVMTSHMQGTRGSAICGIASISDRPVMSSAAAGSKELAPFDDQFL